MIENNQDFIENELKKFSITDAAIADLSSQYMPLKINGLDDKKGQRIVNEARKVIKRYRIDVDKRRKELNADALEYQRRINSEAKRIASLLEPIESHLEAEEKKIEAEIERIKLEKEQEEAAILHKRIEKLLSLDFKFDGIQYRTDYLDTFSNERISIAVLHLKQYSDEDFNEFYENAKHYYEAEKRIQIEKIKAQEAETERLRKLNEELTAEKLRLDAIAKEQSEKDVALKAEAERIERLKVYEESKQAVIDCETECLKNGCEAPIHKLQTCCPGCNIDFDYHFQNDEFCIECNKTLVYLFQNHHPAEFEILLNVLKKDRA